MKKIIYSFLIIMFSFSTLFAQDKIEEKEDKTKKEKTFEEVTKQSK